MKKLTLMLLIVILLLVSCAPQNRTLQKGSVKLPKNEKTVCTDTSNISKIDGFTPVSSNENYELHFDTKLTNILLKEKKTGLILTSIPEDWKKDAIAKGSQKNNMASNLILECYDEGMQPKMVSSYTTSVKKKNFDYLIKDGTISICYKMLDTLSVSLEVYLTPNGMEVNVKAQEIADAAELMIHQITVLPFFGAVKPPSEGYLLVPDGCGALVDVKKNDVRYPIFTNKLYGWDNGLYLPRDDTPSDSFTMPIFGAKSDNKAYLGIIKQRDYMSQISVSSGNTASEYFSIAPVMIVRDFHTIKLFKDTLKQRVVYDLTKETSSTDFIVEYRFLTNGKANYIGMAKEYQTYLLENEMLEKNETESYLDLTMVGAIRVKDTFAGIPKQRVKKLTSFSEATNLLKTLNQTGINSIHLNYKGANKDGYKYNIDTEFEPEPSLGGKKELRELMDYTKNNDIPFSLVGEFLVTENFTGSLKKSHDAIRYSSNYFSMVHTTNPVNFKADPNFISRYVITPQSVPKIVESFYKTTEDVNVTIDDIGSMIYSDFKKDRVVLRQTTGEVWNQMLADLSTSNDYLPIYGANAYVYPYASNLMNVPNYASNQDVESREIPFMQIVLHGYLPYSHIPLNLEPDYQKAILKTLEYGAMPSFELINQGSEWLQRSRYQSLISANKDEWINKIIDLYQKTEAVFKKTSSKEIINHFMVKDKVYCTQFGDFIKLYVNYNEEPQVIEGNKIEGLGYLLLEQGGA